MRNKKGVLRIIQWWDGEKWQDSCMLYMSEMPAFFRRVHAERGNTKFRFRLSGSDRWHVVYSIIFCDC